MNDIKTAYLERYNEKLSEEVISDAIIKWDSLLEASKSVIDTVADADNFDVSDMPKLSDISKSSVDLVNIHLGEYVLTLSQNKLLALLFLKLDMKLMGLAKAATATWGSKEAFRILIETTDE